MADPQVKIIVSVVDKASAAIKGMRSSLGGMNTAFKDLTGISLGAAGGIALVGTALQKGIKFAKDSVKETVEYNKVIREMTQVLGLGSEEISRIIQVGDDWGVSIEAIRTSLAFMNKQGITPSIENIAKLADEYVNTADKSAFAEKAVKVLGRGYQTLIPLLALGGKGFRDATASIKDNMLVTKKSMDASREYETATDELNDAVFGLKQQVGGELIPVLVDLMQTLMGTYDASKHAEDGIDGLDKAFTQFNQGVDGLGMAFQDMHYIWDNFIKATKGQAYHGMSEWLEENTKQVEHLDKGERDLIETTGIVGHSFNDAKNWAGVYRAGLQKTSLEALRLTKKQKELIETLEDSNDAFNNIQASLAGPVGEELENFNEDQDALIEKMGEVQAEIDVLNSKSYLTDAQKKDLEELMKEQQNLQGEYDANAVAHNQATRQILLDILTEKIATADLTESQRIESNKLLVALAEGWGLVDAGTLAAYEGTDQVLDLIKGNKFGDALNLADAFDEIWLQAGGDIALIPGLIQAFIDKMNAIPTEKHTYIYSHYVNLGQLPQERQHGGSVYGGHPYIVGEAGPETFVPNTNGMIIPNRSTTNNFNMNVHTNASSSTLMRDFKFMQQMAG